MRRHGWFPVVLATIDLVLLGAALTAAWRTWLWWRPQLRLIVQVRLSDLVLFNEWMPSALMLILGWVLFLRQLGYYDPLRTPTAVRAAGVLTRSLVYLLVLVVTIEFFMPQRYYSRSLIGSFLAYGFVALGSVRWAFVRAGRMVPVGATARGLAIVGLGQDAQLMEGRLERFGHSQWRMVGFIAPREIDGEDQEVAADRVLGTVYDLVQLVNEHAVEVVVLATRFLGREEALALAMRCDQMGLRVLQVPFTWGLVSPRLRFAELGDLQLIDLSELSYPSLGEHFKRAFDLVAVTLGGLVILPILMAVSLAVKSDGGPMFYASPRVGKGGRAFPFFKFRSMVVGADKLKADLLDQNETDGPLFKMARDPRVTAVGRFIRKYSLDEFPQFLNVLRGDMNLVGPRPLPIGDLEGIENDPEAAYWFELRHKVPPGITGLWQVMGRSDLGFQEMVQLDIYYIQNWSPWLDLKILLLTVPAVLKGRGAA